MDRLWKFWKKTKKELASIPLNLSIEKISYPNEDVDDVLAYQVKYKSLFNETIYGLLLLPVESEKCPLVIEYLGYMNRIEELSQFSHWLTIGCGCLVIDNRDQGGKTFDRHPYQHTYQDDPMGRGFLSKEDFYMRRLIADSLRTVEVAYQLEKVDPSKLILKGVSQGGGAALMVNALADVPILATFADVPSHSNISHRIEMGTGSYKIIHDYLEEFPEKKEQVYQVIDYFDTQYFVDTITNPVYASVGDKDQTCPMEDFLVSYERILSPKTLTVYSNKGHEGGEWVQVCKELEMVEKLLTKKD